MQCSEVLKKRITFQIPLEDMKDYGELIFLMILSSSEITVIIKSVMMNIKNYFLVHLMDLVK